MCAEMNVSEKTFAIYVVWLIMQIQKIYYIVIDIYFRHRFGLVTRISTY